MSQLLKTIFRFVFLNKMIWYYLNVTLNGKIFFAWIVLYLKEFVIIKNIWFHYLCFFLWHFFRFYAVGIRTKKLGLNSRPLCGEFAAFTTYLLDVTKFYNYLVVSVSIQFLLNNNFCFYFHWEMQKGDFLNFVEKESEKDFFHFFQQRQTLMSAKVRLLPTIFFSDKKPFTEKEVSL